MISVQTVVDRMNATLDSEGSDRYLFDQDFKPAINSSVEWLVAVFTKTFADSKLSEEDLKELIVVRLWQANIFSRVHFDPSSTGDDLWSILRVSPEPEVYPQTTPPPLVTPGTSSVYRGDLVFVKSRHAARRLTLEQWNENVDNIFEAGNETLLNGLKSYAYATDITYSAAVGGEIEVRPSVAEDFVAITYLKYPEDVTLISDQILLPKSLTNLVYEKALNFISYKQGDQTNLYTVTARDVQILTNLMM